MLRYIVQTFLRLSSSFILKKYKPDIIAITGSVGKTSTKEACFLVLEKHYRVRRTLKNYNTDISVPFAIIGADPPERSVIKWGVVFVKALSLILITSKRYPQILILELGANKPQDIAYFMSFIQPKISIITAISEAHMENFTKFSKLVSEKRKVIEHLSRDGYAVLNFDDDTVQTVATKTKARVISFGVQEKDVTVKAEEVKVAIKDGAIGLYCKLLYEGTVIPLFIPAVSRVHQVYSILAAAAVGFIYELTPVQVSVGLEYYRPQQGRGVLRQASNGVWFIDDTYNASPVSTRAALTSLVSIPFGKRKIAVLGDMLELGSYSERGHRDIGEYVATLPVDLLITYGTSSKMMSQAAKDVGLGERKCRHFGEKERLLQFLRKELKKEDVVLVKGSRGMHMEEVIEAFFEPRSIFGHEF